MKNNDGISGYRIKDFVGCTSKDWDINQPFDGDILKLGRLVIMFSDVSENLMYLVPLSQTISMETMLF